MNKPRILITTDMECDDMNSMIHLALHLDEIDPAGFVYTASKYHFNGDGIHTLGEVTPHYSCGGELAYSGHAGYPHPDPEAVHLRSYRPFEEGWIESLWKNEYAAVYPNLLRHSPDYPSPEYLLSITKTGNIAFEGDVSEETEGSAFIEQVILDDDERTLYLLSWGGMNTIVRALMSIHEHYAGAACWESVLNKVYKKVCVLGVTDGFGQGNSWLDHGKQLFPELRMLRTEFTHAGFLAAKFAQEDAVHTFRAPWLKENIKFGHGPLMEKMILFADGTRIYGEPENRQYGLITVLDWGWDSMPAYHFDQYDWIGEGDSTTVVPVLPHGLRGLEDGRFGSLAGRLYPDGETLEKKETYNPFLPAFQSEWAARADWCVRPYEACDHPPLVRILTNDCTVSPGETVILSAETEDRDGRGLETEWSFYVPGCTYSAAELPEIRESDSLRASFTIAEDVCVPGCLIAVFSCRTKGVKPITRYGEVMINIRK